MTIKKFVKPILIRWEKHGQRPITVLPGSVGLSLSLCPSLSLSLIFLEDYGSNFFKCILLESYRTDIFGSCMRFV